MIEEQKQIIKMFWNVGLDYRKIGDVLDLLRDKVRNYCKANNVDGYAGVLEDMHIEKVCSGSVYSQCSKSLVNKPTECKRVYCSDECRKV